MPEEFEGGEGSDNLNEPPAFFPYDDAEPARMGELVEVQVEGVFAAENNGQISRCVLLTDGERKLPIIIGPFEAQAIQLVLENTRPDRPLTHDLFRTVLDRLGATLERVVIDDYLNAIYYAKLYLKPKGQEEIEIDARPSDAISLSVRFDCPIYVADAILDQGF